MPYKPNVSELKKMTVAERKKEAMRQLKASLSAPALKGLCINALQSLLRNERFQ